MPWFSHTGWMLLVGFIVIQGTLSDISIPDVIIGDPNSGKVDVLGPPISEEELEESLKLNITDDVLPEEDPIASSGFYQGDIMVDNEDHLIQIVQGDPEGQLSAIRNPNKLWSRGTIPYVISSSFSSSERALIARAMSEYHSRTCIRFVARSSHRDYIHILRGRGCSSQVGRSGGAQIVSLGHGCVHIGVIIHELMHAAGFWHEQSRYDRDNYVTIYWANIQPGLQFNFAKNSIAVTTDLGLPYDYASVMHYGSYAFTRRNGAPTIVSRRAGVTLGQRNGFSELDVQSLNLLYKCSGVKPGPKPKPEGCTDTHRYCSSWASLGYCGSNPGYMNINCKKSCNTCGGGTCIDQGQYCVSWAEKGECQRNPAYMSQYCKKSCKQCGSGGTSNCSDTNQYCGDWARKGECSRNPAYMRLTCKKSCGLC